MVPKHSSPGLGLLPCAVDVVQNPLGLGPGEVGGQRQPGGGGVLARALLATQRGADAVGAGVLPDDGVVHRLTGRALPHHRCLTLIGDADRGDVRRFEVRVGQRSRGHVAQVVPDLDRVVLHPTGLREDLLVLALVDGYHPARVVEDHAAARRGALVNRRDKLLCITHRVPLSDRRIVLTVVASIRRAVSANASAK